MTVCCFKTVSQIKVADNIYTSHRSGLHGNVSVTATSKDRPVTSDTQIKIVMNTEK